MTSTPEDGNTSNCAVRPQICRFAELAGWSWQNVHLIHTSVQQGWRLEDHRVSLEVIILTLVMLPCNTHAQSKGTSVVTMVPAMSATRPLPLRTQAVRLGEASAAYHSFWLPLYLAQASPRSWRWLLGPKRRLDMQLAVPPKMVPMNLNDNSPCSKLPWVKQQTF